MLQAGCYEETQIFGNICQTHHIALSSDNPAGTTQPAASGRTLAVLEDIMQPASPQSDPTLSPVTACKMQLEDLLTCTSLTSTEEIIKWQHTRCFSRSKGLLWLTRGGIIPLTGIPFCEPVTAFSHFTDLSSLSWHKTARFLLGYFCVTLVHWGRSTRERGLQSTELVPGGRREGGSTHFW